MMLSRVELIVVEVRFSLAAESEVDEHVDLPARLNGFEYGLESGFRICFLFFGEMGLSRGDLYIFSGLIYTVA